MINRILAAGLLALAVLLAPGLIALAQTAPTAPSTSIDFGPLVRDLVVPALGVLLTGVVAWALNKWLGIQIKSQDGAIINDAIQNGIAFATSKIQTIPLTVHTGSPVVADASNYVLQHAGEALKRLGVSPQDLAQKVVARYLDPSVPTGVTTAPPVEPAAG